MRKLELSEKMQMSAKGPGIWAASLATSVISETLINIIKLIYDISTGSSGSANSNQNGYANFFTNHAFLKVDKYPSRASLRLGIPWG